MEPPPRFFSIRRRAISPSHVEMILLTVHSVVGCRFDSGDAVSCFRGVHPGPSYWRWTRIDGSLTADQRATRP
ncbi:hypothetical protein Poly30_51320 [Planctomycetes bacterium Poly30]|uniref:Uncharacterized protein n=1 Tax=Saltatorellus ferox TaxID=2528018 RepID=A0A518EZR4_9BACT|nr:hypothetical protein Poly30_51320 [Planctomycetes bacterium Poly30]